MHSSYRRQLFLKGLAIGKSVNWLTFYVFTMLPIRLISGIIGLFMDVSTMSNQQELMFHYSGLIITLVALDFLRCIVTFTVYMNMRKAKPLGYYLNFLALLLDGASTVVNGLLMEKMGETTINLSISLTSAAIWVLPNVIYFVKRKALFYLPDQKDGVQEMFHQMMSGQFPFTGNPFTGANQSQGEGENTNGSQPVIILDPETLTPAKPEEKKEAIRSDLYTYCPYCGEIVEREAEICPNCHEKLK